MRYFVTSLQNTRLKTMKYLYIILISSIAIFTSCDEDDDPLPQVFVDETIFLNNPSNFNLTVVGGWIYHPGGLRGLIIYRQSLDEFIAYERNCLTISDATCSRLEVDSSNTFITCPCDSAQYILFDGSPSGGPASQPVRRYRTSFDGQVIRVRN